MINQLRAYIFIFLQIRTFTPCASGGECNWVETEANLHQGRWYASNQQLPDGTAIVVGGRGAFTVEYVPANGRGQYHLPLLTEVCSEIKPNYYGNSTDAQCVTLQMKIR
jgi:hypothetical protein